MSLEPGTTLGPYSVTAKIGEGGMGEVYRVRGTKLDLDVALKVLPQAFTDDPDRLTRFEREANVLASLNHPNIGGIHGLEESEGTKVPVLELIEGPPRTPDDRSTLRPGVKLRCLTGWRAFSHGSTRPSLRISSMKSQSC